MKSKTRIIFLILIGTLSISLTACERSSTISQPTITAAAQTPASNQSKKLETLESPVSTQAPTESTIIQTDIQTDIQANLVPCQPASIAQTNSSNAIWKPLGTSKALEGIASISIGRLYDDAGFGWKPGLSYAITKEGSAWFWGHAAKDIAFPQPLLGLEHVQEISGSYVLTTDGQVWILKAESLPKKVNGLNEVASIQQLGEFNYTLYILKRNGTVWQLTSDQTIPEPLSGFTDIAALYGSEFSLYILNTAGRLRYLYGSTGSMLEKELPTSMPDKIHQIAVGYNDQVLIQTDNGDMYIYSPNEDTLIRTLVADHAKRMAIVGDGLFLFVKPNGSVWGWGENKNGILGENPSVQSDKPVFIAGLANIVDIQAGTDHVLALDADGYVFSWGSNMTGQLGRIPLIFDQWQEIGTMDGIKQVVTELDKPYLIREDGSLWSLDADRSTHPVRDIANIRTLTGVYGVPITLSTDGTVRIWEDTFASCHILSVPLKIKQIEGGSGSLLLQSNDNRFILVKLKPETEKQDNGYSITILVPEKTEILETEGDWISHVKLLASNEYTYLALAEDGRVYYTDLGAGADLSLTFKPIPDLQGITALAPEFEVYFTLEPSSVWALDQAGSVYEIIVSPVIEHWYTRKDIEVTLDPTKEDGISTISGRLRITKNNQIFEYGWSPFNRRLIPDPVRLISSSYSYANEGPGSHYHLLVTNNNKLVMIGYNPFGKSSSQPKKVIAP